MKKIGLQTFGSEGDINPFLALAGKLSKIGYDITLNITGFDTTSYKKYEKLLSIKVNQFCTPDQDKFNQIREKIIKSSFFKQGSLILEYYLYSNYDILYKSALDLCSNNDLVIGNFLFFPLAFAAEKTNTPRVSLFPTAASIPSDKYPPLGFSNLGVMMNKLLWKIILSSMNIVFNKRINKYRKEIGLKPIHNFFDEIVLSEKLNLVSFTNFLLPYSKTIKNLHFTGFINNENDNADYTLPGELQDFLKDNKPVCFITFGSPGHFDPDPDKTVKLLLKALELADIKGIIQFKWNEVDTSIRTSGSIYKIERIPHKHIFPLCDVIIHHGGAGTTQTALLSGKPSIIISHGIDQDFYGKILEDSRMGPKMLKRKTLTAEKLAKSIVNVINDSTYKNNTTEISKKLVTEKGTDSSIKMIEELL